MNKCVNCGQDTDMIYGQGIIINSKGDRVCNDTCKKEYNNKQKSEFKVGQNNDHTYFNEGWN